MIFREKKIFKKNPLRSFIIKKTSKLSNSILKASKSDFEKSDKNKDGKLSKNEFHSFMKSQGYNLPDNEILIMV